MKHIKHNEAMERLQRESTIVAAIRECDADEDIVSRMKPAPFKAKCLGCQMDVIFTTDISKALNAIIICQECFKIARKAIEITVERIYKPPLI